MKMAGVNQNLILDIRREDIVHTRCGETDEAIHLTVELGRVASEAMKQFMGNGVVEVKPITCRCGLIITVLRNAISQNMLTYINFRLMGIGSCVALLLHGGPDKNNIILGKRQSDTHVVQSRFD